MLTVIIYQQKLHGFPSLYFEDVPQRRARLHVRAPQVGQFPLDQVHDGLLEVVCAVVEEEQHRGADELGPELGQRLGVDGLEEHLQALNRLVHVGPECHHSQPAP